MSSSRLLNLTSFCGRTCVFSSSSIVCSCCVIWWGNSIEIVSIQFELKQLEFWLELLSPSKIKSNLQMSHNHKSLKAKCVAKLCSIESGPCASAGLCWDCCCAAAAADCPLVAPSSPSDLPSSFSGLSGLLFGTVVSPALTWVVVQCCREKEFPCIHKP